MNEPARWYHILGAAAGLAGALWVMWDLAERRPAAPAPALRVFTDESTGYQYLTAGRGGSLVARTDAEGAHMGCMRVRRVGGAWIVKPRLNRTASGNWRCTGAGVSRVALTPEGAYCAWAEAEVYRRFGILAGGKGRGAIFGQFIGCGGTRAKALHDLLKQV